MQLVASLPQVTPGTAPDDRVFRALADPNRRRLLDRLHERSGQTLGELCKGLGMARQSVSQHLGFLEQANLVAVQWQGRQKRHFINPLPIRAVYARWVRKFETHSLAALQPFNTNIEGSAYD
jgi:DNA-binding transcriptional ArsR family regulator